MARPPPAPFPPEPGPGEFPNAPNLQTLPELPISSLGDDWVVDFEELQAYNKAGVAGKRTKVLNEQWLASEKDWKYRVGKGWKGKKVLGQGGQGIVGHWTYEGPDRDQKTVKDIAIKQAVRFGVGYRWGDGLESEAKWLAKFARTKTPHIVRMYKHLYQEEGQKTVDLDWGTVQRIYLEFCPAGDLRGWLNRYYSPQRNVPESDLWCIFQCLARAAFVIHHGSEDPKSPRYMKDSELIHLDLKLENVLIGEQTLDTEHRYQPPYKLTDFGMAQEVTTVPQDANYLKKWQTYGTPPWYAPEQITSILHPFAFHRPWTGLVSNFFNPMVQNPHYGTPTNIWQIGLIMQVLMRKPPGGRPDWPDWPNYTTYKSTATPRLKRGGPTVGSLLDAEQDYTGCNSIYSRELRSLIAECLILTPANRIPVQELVKRTVDGIASVQMSMGTVLGGPALSKWQEPVLSEQWLSGQNGVDPLASGFEASQIQGNQQRGQHAATRPPVLPMPAPPAPPRPQAQAQAPQAGPAQAAGPAARPTRPANASPFNRLRVIAQTKPKYSGLVAGGHKIFVVEDVNVNTTVVQVKDILERKGCGIKATGMNMMYGTKLMLNHQTLGEFPGLDAVRAMDA